jgi:hypothetical protein
VGLKNAGMGLIPDKEGFFAHNKALFSIYQRFEQDKLDLVQI